MSGDDEKGMPPGWVTAKVGDTGRYINGLAFKPTDWGDEGRPIIRIQNLTDRDRGFNRTTAVIHTDFIVKTGEILVSWSATLDAFVWRGEEGVLNQHIFRVEPESRLVISGFLFPLLRHAIRELVRSEHLHGSTMKHINRGPFLSHEVPVPPLNEQKRIVAKIEALQARSDAAKEALDAIPPLLEKFRQSVLAAAFRGDLTKKWRAQNPDVEPASKLLERIRAERRRRWQEANPRKKYVEPEPVDTEGLPELPEGWCWASLDDLLVDIVAGKSPKAEGRPAGQGEVGVLKVSAVSWGEFRPEENKVLVGGLPKRVPTVAKNDLLISRANTVELVGAVVLVRDDYPNLMLCDKTLRLDVVSCVDKSYILCALRTAPVRAVFEDQATGTSDSMRNLSHVKIKSAPIPIAPAAEQAEIVARMSDALDLGVEQGRRVRMVGGTLASLNQSILAKAFRGELVPQDPDDEPASVLLERIRRERAAEGGRVKQGRGKSKGAG